jgi:hypothetical protein
LKNTPKLVPVGTNTRRKAKKGNSTQKTKKSPSKPRFYEVKFRLTADEYVRGLPYFEEKKYLPRFMQDAYREKVNRSEAYDKTSRLRTLAANAELFLPTLKYAAAQGQLDFLKEILKGPENG